MGDPIGSGTRELRALARRMRLHRHRVLKEAIEWAIVLSVVALLFWLRKVL